MATLKNLVDETTNIKNELTSYHSDLKNNLVGIKIPVQDTDKLKVLIDKVKTIIPIPTWANNHNYIFMETGQSVGLTGYNYQCCIDEDDKKIYAVGGTGTYESIIEYDTELNRASILKEVTTGGARAIRMSIVKEGRELFISKDIGGGNTIVSVFDLDTNTDERDFNINGVSYTGEQLMYFVEQGKHYAITCTNIDIKVYEFSNGRPMEIGNLRNTNVALNYSFKNGDLFHIFVNRTPTSGNQVVASHVIYNIATKTWTTKDLQIPPNSTIIQYKAFKLGNIIHFLHTGQGLPTDRRIGFTYNLDTEIVQETSVLRDNLMGSLVGCNSNGYSIGGEDVNSSKSSLAIILNN